MRLSLLSLIVISSTGLVATAGTIGVVDYFAGDLPSITSLQSTKLNQTTRILDRNGNLIEALYHENRTVVPLSKISIKLQRATIDTEDRTFYSNSGVDYRRMAIAVVYNLTHPSSVLGGSTITQQVVKNDVLDTEEAQRRTINRKFRELLLAEEMERRYTKAQILELYLNSINYGSGAYGAEAAAQMYFQGPASDLTWAQASFLAGLPQAPSDYDVFGTAEQVAAAKSRWRGVLDGIVKMGDLTRPEADHRGSQDEAGAAQPPDGALRRLCREVHHAALWSQGAVRRRPAHHDNARPAHAGDGGQMGEVGRGGMGETRREHRRDAGHEPGGW
jgi:penicillin-binding protein 1A